ncbi:uncharacterized protein N7477_007285 [Penicillium maclennaniae]|uniref:uncharacterized protein n=1 Tax=Penicillium maclennaniae TaxID=1343394 RepID=UPI00253FEC48|nr:uncharacterized protein N7477_007285 [Penicillium maclennaniae]KAJ5664837.1 hypothetical protein N7477_007285 [Penicillium maclennaniae]
MPKLRDFLYTGYYAIVESDVADYSTKVKIATKCITCNNYLRLLCLHKELFETARYLKMELLQLLAMDKFARAIEGAQPIVLQAMVQEVYTMYPWSEPDLRGNAYRIAGFLDFRPQFIMHAVVKLMTNEDPELWTRTNSRAKSVWNISTAAPVDLFEELRGLFPKFDQDLNRALGVLSDAPQIWGSSPGPAWSLEDNPYRDQVTGYGK